MVWTVYGFCHEVARTVMGTLIIWPLNQAAFEFAWWLSGIIVGVK